MARQWRHALWGYRIKSAKLYVESLEARVADRRQMRETSVRTLKTELQDVQAAVDASEVVLRSFQNDYFRLSGELHAITIRSEQLLEAALADWQAIEQTTQSHVQTKRHYKDSLADTIRTVPDEIRGIIERIARSMTQFSAGSVSEMAPRVIESPPNHSPEESHG